MAMNHYQDISVRRVIAELIIGQRRGQLDADPAQPVGPIHRRSLAAHRLATRGRRDDHHAG
jgi:hypothetical protein